MKILNIAYLCLPSFHTVASNLKYESIDVDGSFQCPFIIQLIYEVVGASIFSLPGYTSDLRWSEIPISAEIAAQIMA